MRLMLALSLAACAIVSATACAQAPAEEEQRSPASLPRLVPSSPDSTGGPAPRLARIDGTDTAQPWRPPSGGELRTVEGYLLDAGIVTVDGQDKQSFVLDIPTQVGPLSTYDQVSFTIDDTATIVFDGERVKTADVSFLLEGGDVAPKATVQLRRGGSLRAASLTARSAEGTAPGGVTGPPEPGPLPPVDEIDVAVFGARQPGIDAGRYWLAIEGAARGGQPLELRGYMIGVATGGGVGPARLDLSVPDVVDGIVIGHVVPIRLTQAEAVKVSSELPVVSNGGSFPVFVAPVRFERSQLVYHAAGAPEGR